MLRLSLITEQNSSPSPHAYSCDADSDISDFPDLWSYLNKMQNKVYLLKKTILGRKKVTFTIYFCRNIKKSLLLDFDLFKIKAALSLFSQSNNICVTKLLLPLLLPLLDLYLPFSL